MSQQQQNDPRIAPFPFEQTDDKGRIKAYLKDIAEVVEDFCKNNDREYIGYVDPRAVAYWFQELNVLWDGDTINAYQEDQEGSPWVIEWNMF